MVKFTDRPKYEQSIRLLLREVATFGNNEEREPLALEDFLPGCTEMAQIPLEELPTLEKWLQQEVEMHKRHPLAYGELMTNEQKADFYFMAIMDTQAALANQQRGKSSFVPWALFHSLWRDALNAEMADIESTLHEQQMEDSNAKN